MSIWNRWTITGIVGFVVAMSLVFVWGICQDRHVEWLEAELQNCKGETE